jgi:hypothetical protein
VASCSEIERAIEPLFRDALARELKLRGLTFALGAQSTHGEAEKHDRQYVGPVAAGPVFSNVVPLRFDEFGWGNHIEAVARALAGDFAMFWKETGPRFATVHSLDLKVSRSLESMDLWTRLQPPTVDAIWLMEARPTIQRQVTSRVEEDCA